VPLKKYGTAELRDRYLPHLLRRDGTNWQGATWMTEVKGGSDLGANVETIARPVQQTVQSADRSGSKGPLAPRRATNTSPATSGAELAIVAARPAGAPSGPKGLALFLVPRYREVREGASEQVSVPGARATGSELNYFIRRLKNKIGTRSVPTGEVELRDSEAYLLGKQEWGIYLILESLNLSRVGNITGSVGFGPTRARGRAHLRRRPRLAFGKPICRASADAAAV
jgi:alkylation response protein AidB-like acyl-CoA dehydrogenase